MVDVELDADGVIAALRRRRYHDVPIAIVDRSGQVAADQLLAMVVSSVAVADGKGQQRVPDDPTGASDPTLLPDGMVVISIDNGLMTAAEVRIWLADLAAAISDPTATVNPDASLTIRAHAPARRPRSTDAWLSFPAAPTAFLRFSTPDASPQAPADLEQLVRALCGWVRLPSEDLVVRIGMQSFFSSPERVVEDLLHGLTRDPQCKVAEFRRTKPRACRMVRFDHDWLGALQLYDESKPIRDSFDAVIDGMRSCAPFLDYAYCRAAATTMPYETDPPFHLGRPLTPGEELLRLGLRPLWNTSVPQAYLAQILTSRHLERLGDTIDGYRLEELGHERYLLISLDPDAWMNQGHPSPQLQEQADNALRQIILTKADAHCFLQRGEV